MGPLWAVSVGCWRGVALYSIIILAHVEAFPHWMGDILALDEDLSRLALLGHLVCLMALLAWLSTFMNAWLRKSLVSKGYVEADMVMALDGSHAVSVSSLVRPPSPAYQLNAWRSF